MNSLARFICKKCRTPYQFDARNLKYVRQREVELQALEQSLRDREQRLSVREAEHESGVRLIKNCLHPDKHPEQIDRYTRALQAFEQLLASARKPDDMFDPDIPF
jgi:hypothetical protein